MPIFTENAEWCPCPVCQKRKEMAEKTIKPMWAGSFCLIVGVIFGFPTTLIFGFVLWFYVLFQMAITTRYAIKTYNNCPRTIKS
jgi:hypothetical protein